MILRFATEIELEMCLHTLHAHGWKQFHNDSVMDSIQTFKKGHTDIHFNKLVKNYSFTTNNTYEFYTDSKVLPLIKPTTFNIKGIEVEFGNKVIVFSKAIRSMTPEFLNELQNKRRELVADRVLS